MKKEYQMHQNLSTVISSHSNNSLSDSGKDDSKIKDKIKKNKLSLD